MNNIKSRNNLGFTIVELLIVIIIIGILAAITIVSYIGITKKANEASLQSDLTNNSKKLDMYRAQYDEYPHVNSSTGCPEAPSTPDNNYCLKFSGGNTFEYTYKTPLSYELKATKDTVTFSISESKAPALSLSCPTGFVLIPGSSTYGTTDFCVMKYEAKADNNGDGIGDTTYTTNHNSWPADSYPISASRKLVSTPDGYPVANISQTTATSAAQNFTKDCTGCHLVSEAEWMTIAQNVLGVASNWSSGAVGSGFIYSGHNDDPILGNVLVAASNDVDGYSGTGQAVGGNQRRTLTLSNGNVIWDIAGNASVWSSSKTTGGQPGIVGRGYFEWREYPTLTSAGSSPVNITPTGTGINNASLWTSTNGIGQIFSNIDDVTSVGFIRGGGYNQTISAGVLSLSLLSAPSTSGYGIGFRVAAPAL